MARALRYAGYGLLTLFGIALLALAIIYGLTEYELRRSHVPANRSHVPANRSAALSASLGSLAEGHRLADILGCTGCHEANLQGGKFFSEPKVATVYASSLTRRLPAYNDEQLEAAIRQGIRRDGSTLIAMPSSTFVSLSDEDLAKLVQYLRTLPPAGTDKPRASIGLLGRLGLLMGKFKPEVAHVEEATTTRPVFVGQEHERGRYIAGITCAECHSFDLSGVEGDTPDLALAGAYDAAQFERLMRTGEGAAKRDLGLMSQVARSRFSRFTPAEVRALHDYLITRAEQAPASE